MDEIGKRINAFLEMVVEQGGSDLHLVSGNPPRMRLFGEIYPIKYRKLTENEVMDLLTQVMSEQKRSEFEEHGGADFFHMKYRAITFSCQYFSACWRSRGGLSYHTRANCQR